jgi:soluble lytic murein transglycosylase-like protein
MKISGDTSMLPVNGSASEGLRLKSAGQDFERLLVEQMLKSMEQSLEGGLTGKASTGSDWYTGIFNQEMARVMTDDGAFGLAGQLLEQLERQPGELPSEAGQLRMYHGSARIPAARFTPPSENRASELKELARSLAREVDLDEDLALAMVSQESAWDERARSKVGAMGLAQLMPETARDLGVENPWNPEENLRGGFGYLRSLIDEFGSNELALAAYNAGPGAVRHFQGVPPFAETREYVSRILARLEDGQ